MRYMTASTLALTLLGTAALAQQETDGTLQPVENGMESGSEMQTEEGAAPGVGMPSAQDPVGADMGTGMGADMGTDDMSGANLIRTRDIIGGPVYTLGQNGGEGWDPTNYYSAIDTGWNQVGEIEDLVLSRDGQLTGLVAEVGGFLDIGDKHVLIQLGEVSLVATDDRQIAYVTRLTEEELTNMENIDEGFWE
jgi:hypothetical protein